MDVSVVIATARRADELDRTLTSIASGDFPASRFEVVVVDNADDPATAEVCRRHKGRLRLKRLVETAGGKNAALNRALERIKGSLVVFTDDDVTAAPGWLSELWVATSRWPDHFVFGGRILPEWPGTCPGYVLDSKYFRMLFAALDPPFEEGPHEKFEPFGPNLAIRREVFDQGFRYDPSIGPGTATSYIMGSETEFTRRLQDAGFPSIYVPTSVVHHHIRPTQLRLSAMLARGVRYGKMHQLLHELPEGTYWAGVPRWFFRELAQHVAAAFLALLRRRKGEAFNRAMDAALTWGRVRFCRESARGGLHDWTGAGASRGEHSS